MQKNLNSLKKGWQVPCEIKTYQSDHGSIRFDRKFKFATCFEFRQTTDEAIVDDNIILCDRKRVKNH